jgi:hypothetical protein
MLRNDITSVGAPFDENDGPAIRLPPPTSGSSHRRSRTTVDLPPLFARTPSSSPTRLSTFLPSLRSPSRNNSPERVSIREAAEFDVDGTRPTIQKHKSSASVAKLASWFDGASEPVNITLVPSPRKERPDPLQDEAQANTMFSASNEEMDTLTKRPLRPATASGQASRFSFFRKASQVQLAPTDQDELAQMDIRDALFPMGQPDEFSPAAFKNLQLNAEGALRRFQHAHLEQRKALKSVTAAKSVQADELEAAQTRSEHLKLQLVEFAERAAEQDRLIAALRAELDVSRPHCPIELPQSSIRKVSQTTMPKWRRNRSSDISSADSEGSDAVSIFSEPMSAMDSPGTSVAASPVLKQAVVCQPRLQHSSGYQAAIIPVPECQKCHGLRSNEAWDVVSMMKAESQALKERITELEGAQDDALDFLNGLKIT